MKLNLLYHFLFFQLIHPQLFYTFQERYSKRNRYDNFTVLQGRKPQKEMYRVVIPDFVRLKYTCTIWCDYVAQMNKLIEMINYTSDSYWGDKERFKFNAKIDTYSNTVELAQGSQRQIKTEFGLKLQGYLVPDSINKELAKKPQKYFNNDGEPSLIDNGIQKLSLDDLLYLLILSFIFLSFKIS